MKIEKWEKLKTEIIGHFKIFTLKKQTNRSQYSQRTGDFYVLDFPDWVNIIAVDEDENVLLIEQYRQGSDSVCLEIPGGACDPGEDPLVSAKRELLEETGFEAENWEKLGEVLPNPAIQNNYSHFYLATNIRKTQEQKLDSMEEIEVKKVAFSEVESLFRTKKIQHSLVVSAFFFYALRKNSESIRLF